MTKDEIGHFLDSYCRYAFTLNDRGFPRAVVMRAMFAEQEMAKKFALAIGGKYSESVDVAKGVTWYWVNLAGVKLYELLPVYKPYIIEQKAQFEIIEGFAKTLESKVPMCMRNALNHGAARKKMVEGMRVANRELWENRKAKK